MSEYLRNKLVRLRSIAIQSSPEEHAVLNVLNAAKNILSQILVEINDKRLNSLRKSNNIYCNFVPSLWASVRNRGCQFLGPAVQDEILRLVLLAMQDGTFLCRKVLVLYIVQKMESRYPKLSSKTAIGHVVQLLYRASCFRVEKKEGKSSLMQLRSHLRTYDQLRNIHDREIVQIAKEAGICYISADQWSQLLYGDSDHEIYMLNILIQQNLRLCDHSSIEAFFFDKSCTKAIKKFIVDSEFVITANTSQLKYCLQSLDWMLRLYLHVVYMETLQSREPYSDRYKTTMCRNNNCSRSSSISSQCRYAHNTAELSLYKNNGCMTYFDIRNLAELNIVQQTILWFENERFEFSLIDDKTCTTLHDIDPSEDTLNQRLLNTEYQNFPIGHTLQEKFGIDMVASYSLETISNSCKRSSIDEIKHLAIQNTLINRLLYTETKSGTLAIPIKTLNPQSALLINSIPNLVLNSINNDGCILPTLSLKVNESDSVPESSTTDNKKNLNGYLKIPVSSKAILDPFNNLNSTQQFDKYIFPKESTIHNDKINTIISKSIIANFSSQDSADISNPQVLNQSKSHRLNSATLMNHLISDDEFNQINRFDANSISSKSSTDDFSTDYMENENANGENVFNIRDASTTPLVSNVYSGNIAMDPILIACYSQNMLPLKRGVSAISSGYGAISQTANESRRPVIPNPHNPQIAANTSSIVPVVPVISPIIAPNHAPILPVVVQNLPPIVSQVCSTLIPVISSNVTQIVPLIVPTGTPSVSMLPPNGTVLVPVVAPNTAPLVPVVVPTGVPIVPLIGPPIISNSVPMVPLIGPQIMPHISRTALPIVPVIIPPIVPIVGTNSSSMGPGIGSPIIPSVTPNSIPIIPLIAPSIIPVISSNSTPIVPLVIPSIIPVIASNSTPIVPIIVPSIIPVIASNNAPMVQLMGPPIVPVLAANSTPIIAGITPNIATTNLVPVIAQNGAPILPVIYSNISPIPVKASNGSLPSNFNSTIVPIDVGSSPLIPVIKSVRSQLISSSGHSIIKSGNCGIENPLLPSRSSSDNFLEYKNEDSKISMIHDVPSITRYNSSYYKNGEKSEIFFSDNDSGSCGKQMPWENLNSSFNSEDKNTKVSFNQESDISDFHKKNMKMSTNIQERTECEPPVNNFDSTPINYSDNKSIIESKTNKL